MQDPTRPDPGARTFPRPSPGRLILRPGTVDEAVQLIEAAAASGARVVVADLPVDGLLLGGRS